jgi:hypothetical protein
MNSIEIDFDVYKALTIKRANEATTYNDVLREILGLPAKLNGAGSAPAKSDIAWIAKGVTFPAGTEFRATYKGVQHLGIVKEGALHLNGKTFTSPSAAAVSIADSAVNGWNFWEAKTPGSSSWKLINHMRK